METFVDDSSVPYISRFKNLKALGIGGTSITNIGLKRLMPLRKLDRLSVEALSGLTDESIKIIQHQWPNIRHLCLNRTKLSQIGLLQLYGLRKLRVLELADYDLGDSVMSMVTTLPLVELNLNRAKYSPDWLRSISKMKTLKYLMISRIDNVPDTEYNRLRQQLAGCCKVEILGDPLGETTEVKPLIDMIGGD